MTRARIRNKDLQDISPADTGGSRLDRALAALVPGLGLRGRRRLVATGRVLLNGRPCLSPARKLRPGDRLSLTGGVPDQELPGTTPSASAVPRAADGPETHETEDIDGTGDPGDTGAGGGARLLARADGYCFFFKPAGLHTVALAGSADPSLEELLPALMAASLPATHARPAPASGQEGATAPPRLLQRLDRETSGLVCAAPDAPAALRFRDAEAAGRCEKRYLALLAGELHRPCTVRRALDTRHRRKCRVLEEDAGPARWTDFVPLHVLTEQERNRVNRFLRPWDAPGHGNGATLAGCVIRRGQRHQIRAHAASLGHPLLGDTLYGPEACAACPGRQTRGTTFPAFFLHHGSLRLPHAACAVPPPWPWLALLPASVARAVARWFGTDGAGD